MGVWGGNSPPSPPPLATYDYPPLFHDIQMDADMRSLRAVLYGQVPAPLTQAPPPPGGQPRILPHLREADQGPQGPHAAGAREGAHAMPRLRGTIQA